MNKFIFMLCLVISNLVHAADMDAIFRLQTKSIVKVKNEKNEDAIAMIVMGGTAFSIALPDYKKKNILLTACHNIIRWKVDGTPELQEEIYIEIPNGAEKSWVQCKVLKFDVAKDLAILQLPMELPTQLKLTTTDSKKGDKMLLVGSLLGNPIQAFKGELEKKYDMGKLTYRAKVDNFNHGMSGGPVISVEEDTVVGVIIEGYMGPLGPLDPNLDPHIGLYVPIHVIESFLRDDK